MSTFEAVVFGKEEKYIRDFLLLPKQLYDRKNCPQNEREEDMLLRGSHVLSKYFAIRGILVYQDQCVAARCLITLYPGDESAYIGFFECIDDHACAAVLFREAKNLVRNEKRRRIVGPVNASFWIGYRLKTNSFDRRPYFGEPYNLSYYPALFADAGFAVADRYTSNRYGRFPLLHHRDGKGGRRYREFLRKGYTFVSPNAHTIDSFLHEIYRMISHLYRDFPIYKDISEDDFAAHFSGFRQILDYRFVKLVYFRGEAVGFTVGVPDYRNMLCGKLSVGKLLRMSLQRIRSGNYVSLYMGVMPGHLGLGSAMSEVLLQFVRIRRAASITALMRDGKVTKGYQKDKVKERYAYSLLTYTFEE